MLSQPYKGLENPDPDFRGAILLFPGDEMVRNLGSGFDRPLDPPDEYPSGLYLSPISRRGQNTFEDETKFVLPFKIGRQGYAKSSDLALFSENTEAEDATPKDMNDKLFSPGHNPYIEMHNMQLYRVLEKWADMVEEGSWDVDENGVAGGMEKFKNADTEEHWEKYVIDQDW